MILLSAAEKYRPSYTIDDYRHWEGAWELWSGTAVAMSPSPFGLHAALLIKIGKLLDNAIEDNGCSATVLAEIDWIVSSDTVVRPDLSVVCGGPPARHVESAPALVVEILSEGTRERDPTHKKELYRQNHVALYLIVDPDKSTSTLWKLDGQSYIEHPAGEPVSLCDDCPLELDCSQLFDPRSAT